MSSFGDGIEIIDSTEKYAPAAQSVIPAPNKVAGMSRRLDQHLLLLFTRLVPTHLWYTLVWRWAAVEAYVNSLTYAKRIERVEGWMRRFTQQGMPFPIPCEVVGMDVLPPAGRVENGILYCSAHIPMVRMGHHALVKLGLCPTATIADPAIFAPGTHLVPVWGTQERIPGIASGRHSLVKARSILRQGGSVSLLTDTVAGGSHSRSAFQLSRRLGTQMIFLFTEVDSGGHVVVTFKRPPYPVCSTEESIQFNIKWLEAELNKLSHGVSTSAPGSSRRSPPA